MNVTKRTVVALLLATASTMSVTGVRMAAAQSPGSSVGIDSRGRLTGVVFDSLAGAPLADAAVQLVERANPARSSVVRSDARGAFAFDALPAGDYVVGFVHPRLDSLLLASPVQQVRVADEGAARLTLFIPSRLTLARALCGAKALEDSSAILLGHVRSARAGARPAQARIRVQWTELVIDKGLRSQHPTLVAETNQDGAFAICGLPASTQLLVQSWTDTDTSGVIEVDMPATGLSVQDVLVGAFERTLVARSVADDGDPVDAASDRGAMIDSVVDSVVDSVAVLRGTGRVRGVVRRQNGAPVPGVRVTIRESGLTAITDSSGAFYLQSLPTGSHLLEALAIGFTPTRVPIDITSEANRAFDVTMRPVEAVLDTLRVFATRDNATWIKDFEQRRKMGMGKFFDEAQINRLDPLLASDVLRRVPYVTIQPGRFTSKPLLYMRSGRPGLPLCIPTLYLNGVPVDLSDGILDAVVSAQEVRSVEVYRSPILVPAQFKPLRSCGVIVMWTGMRRPTPTTP